MKNAQTKDNSPTQTQPAPETADTTADTIPQEIQNFKTTIHAKAGENKITVFEVEIIYRQPSSDSSNPQVADHSTRGGP